jgi:hypothetical protein
MKRFISEDPLGVAGGVNLYQYVGGMPTIFVDPLGLWIYCAINGGLKDSNGDYTGYTGYSGTNEPGPGGISMQNNPGSSGFSHGTIWLGGFDIGPSTQFISLVPGGGRTYGLPLTPDRTNPDRPTRPQNPNKPNKQIKIHPDNGKNNKSASWGCIVLPQKAIDMINKSNDKRLNVSDDC